MLLNRASERHKAQDQESKQSQPLARHQKCQEKMFGDTIWYAKGFPKPRHYDYEYSESQNHPTPTFGCAKPKRDTGTMLATANLSRKLLLQRVVSRALLSRAPRALAAFSTKVGPRCSFLLEVAS